MQKCSKCKKTLELSKFETKSDGDLYATCIDCHTIHNKQSRESYKRKEKNICEVCQKTYSTKSNLKQHLWQVHTIGEGKWFNCSECEAKFKTNSNLKKHLWRVHTIGDGEWFNCSKCNYKCKNQCHLKRHLWQVHNIGEEKWFDCTECDYRCKDNSYLKRHLWQKHNIGEEQWFNCYECDYTCKTNGNLKKHLWQVHTIGEGEWFNCSNCDYKCKTNGDLKVHLWQVHTIGEGKWFNCSECDYKCKNNKHLKRHLSNVHDIGNLTCNYCQKNVFHLNDYTDKNTGKVKICRDCYNKATGYSTKKEKQMVEYIKKTELKHYIILQDKIIKGDYCGTKCRPDLMLSSSKELTIFVECDEFQHSGYPPDCETGRMNEIIDEVKGHRVVFIRWNPDGYMVKKHRGKVNREQRLEMLVELIRKLCNKRWKEKDNIMVYYMFYTDDNPIITESLERKIIYEKEDYEELKN